MSDIQPTMTALETRFDEELSTVPGWHSEFMDLEHAHTATDQTNTERDKAVEQAMILGA